MNFKKRTKGRVGRKRKKEGEGRWSIHTRLGSQAGDRRESARARGRRELDARRDQRELSTQNGEQ